MKRYQVVWVIETLVAPGRWDATRFCFPSRDEARLSMEHFFEPNRYRVVRYGKGGGRRKRAAR